MTSEPKPKQERQFPPFFEKFIPIALGVLVVLIVLMLLFAAAVVAGVF